MVIDNNFRKFYEGQIQELARTNSTIQENSMAAVLFWSLLYLYLFVLELWHF